MLSALRRQGPPYQLSPGALLHATLVTSGTMTNRIDRLAPRAGQPARDQQDKRGVLVTLTERGKQVGRRCPGRTAGPRAPAADRSGRRSAGRTRGAAPGAARAVRRPRRAAPRLGSSWKASSPARQREVSSRCAVSLPSARRPRSVHSGYCQRAARVRQRAQARAHRCIPRCGQAVALAPAPRYYVSLGDSLARGVQPDASGASVPTGGGYPDRVYAVLHRDSPGLRLVKLGCSGETSYTMIRGGICHYPGRLPAGPGRAVPAHPPPRGRAGHARHRRQRPQLVLPGRAAEQGRRLHAVAGPSDGQ